MRPRRPARSLGKGGGRRAFPSRPHIVLLKDGLSPRPAGHFWTCSEKCAKGCPRWSTAKGNALDQVREIFAALFARTGFVLGTPRIGRHAAAVQSEAPKPRCTIRSAACSHWERRRRPINRDRAAVVWAGPSDEPVAQEAVGTLEAFGHPVVTVKDAGVGRLAPDLSPPRHAERSSGRHRRGRHRRRAAERRRRSRRRAGDRRPDQCWIRGELRRTVRLLACSTAAPPESRVVNIDNGFGAACAASLIARKVSRDEGHRSQ